VHNNFLLTNVKGWEGEFQNILKHETLTTEGEMDNK
jgi:hypothetical protein